MVERVLRGEDPDVEGLVAAAPEMSAETREALRKIAGTFGAKERPIALAQRATTTALIPPATTDASPATTSPRKPPLPFAALGPYKLVSAMGEGGMGIVYLAEHEFLKRRVALKIIRPELVFSDAMRRRFHREAMSIAKLRHDNIVSVYDAGEHAGVMYLALELVEGQGLDEQLRAGQRTGRSIDVLTAVRYARDIAIALQAAHDAGIVHRDVKPSNVRITPEGRALLLDFGLSWAEGMASLSSVGHFSGTPQYASPEQIETSAADIDARTDVYSLGITLYECLTGRLPFAATNMRQLFHQILALDPPDVRKLNDAIDQELNDIVMRAIDKSREKRFASAREMADALDDWLRRATSVAPPPQRAHSRKRVTLAAIGAVALALVAWLAFHRGASDAAPPSSSSSTPEPAIASSSTEAAQSAQASSPTTAPQSTPSSSSTPALLVASSPSRNHTLLFGARDAAFNERLSTWDPLVGGGTFGPDEDGLGVIGTSNEGITTRAHVLPGGNGSVAGRVATLELAAGGRTLAAGVGVEFSNGRVAALLVESADDGRDACLCELVRDANSRWTRGALIERIPRASNNTDVVSIHLRWNASDTQFEYSGASATASSSPPLLVPRELRAGAQPSRVLLIVEKGNARFEDLTLDES